MVVELSHQEKYEEAMKVKEEQRKQILDLVNKYEIQLKDEKDFPRPLRNVMTCELRDNAYQELYKKGEFF